MIHIGELTIENLYIGEIEIDKAYLGEELVYEKEQPTPSIRAVKFSTTGSNSVAFSGSNASTKNLEYSYDGNTWSSWTNPTSALSFSGGTNASTGSEYASVYMGGDWQKYANTKENKNNFNNY